MIEYVNVYEITRCYGGPEEGGWWYDEGEIVESHGPFTDQETADKFMLALCEKYSEKNGFFNQHKVKIEEARGADYSDYMPYE